jgi:ferredoxin
MEGQGPGSGSPRELGSLFAAHDAVALDVALADRTAHERRAVHTVAASVRRGLVNPSDPYVLAGDPIEPDTAFKPAGRDMQSLLPPVLHRATRNLVTARPRLVDESACTRCGDCATTCGAHAITLDPLPLFDDKLCVRCYACTEMCPTAAIDNVTPRLARLFTRRG